MSPIERLLACTLVLIALATGAWLGLEHYGAAQYQAGHDAAVAAGEKLRQAAAERNRETETELRAELAELDAAAHRKEQEYATNLEAAQRRVRAGTDRLRCPAASPVQPAAAPGDRPAAGGPQPDAERADLVPEAAADLLGIAADAAGLLRKFDRLEQRFEACRALNAK